MCIHRYTGATSDRLSVVQTKESWFYTRWCYSVEADDKDVGAEVFSPAPEVGAGWPSSANRLLVLSSLELPALLLGQLLVRAIKEEVFAFLASLRLGFLRDGEGRGGRGEKKKYRKGAVAGKNAPMLTRKREKKPGRVGKPGSRTLAALLAAFFSCFSLSI